MGQKIHPRGFRLGISQPWNSKWYAERADYANRLNSDIEIREFIKKKLSNASVSRIYIERPANSVNVSIHTARPGVVIGKKGEDIEKLRKSLAAIVKTDAIQLSIEEVRKPDIDSYLVAENIAQQLERRVMFRRAMKRAVGNAMRGGALGIKVSISGRLNGAEIARTEWYREGQVPLHTLRADVDYGLAEANTTYGIIGVKVWIYKGEVFDLEQKIADEKKGKRNASKRA